jgi:hypothetical protein
MHAAGLATMAYYYFDFRDVKKQDCYGLLSSLVSQFSADSDACYNILSKLYSDHIRGTRKPDIDALKECMTDMLNLPGQGPIYIIVDGLDECPNFRGGRPPAGRSWTSSKNMLVRNFGMYIYVWLVGRRWIFEWSSSCWRLRPEHADMDRGGQATCRRYAI